ncbi:MAG: 4-hydroxy-tetrahydrodipicolinate synthase [Bacteroidales bacterium]|nr:4-hydroxy-tetrahydrodipicolinate synthase [Bacteroidales bacterium]
MRKLLLKGCGTALVTPFRGGKIDEEAYIRLVLRQVESGVDFLVPLATTGETPALDAGEKLRLLRLAREQAAGLPLLCGCGSNSVSGTVANIRALEGEGADAWLVVVPFYNKPTQQGQYDYFRAIADETDKPIVIYNVPGRTGVNMEASTVLRLADDCPQIIGIKEASGRFSQASEIIRCAPETFSVLSGDDDLTFPIMAAGGQGVISVASNAAPAEVTQMTGALLEGDFLKAREWHHRLSPLFKACFVESNPIPVKAAMECLGLCSREVRLPLSPATQATVETMKAALENVTRENY